MGTITGETIGEVRDQDGAYLGGIVYWTAGPDTRWTFTRTGGHVLATARTASWGFELTGAATGAYPTLTVAAQDVYGQRVLVTFTEVPATV